MSVFVTYWDGAPLSQYEQLCLRSFIQRGHSVELSTYHGVTGIPDGVTIRDARVHLPLDDDIALMLERQAYSKVSDILRYRLLDTAERTWVDVDIMLLAEELPTDLPLFGLEDDHHANTAVLRVVPDSALRDRLLSETHGLAVEDILSAEHGAYSPLLLTRLIDELGLRALALQPAILYPIASRDLWRLFDPEEREWCERSLSGAATLHLWNEFLRRADVKHRRPPRGSWLDRAMQAHGVPQHGEALRVPWVRGPWRQQLPEPPQIPMTRPPARSIPRRAFRKLSRTLRTLLTR
jgi:hypothetical protein